MRCCKSPSDLAPDAGRRRGLRLAAVAGWVGLGGLTVLASWARAESDASTVTLSRRGDGLFLSARMPLELTPAMEEVLTKGVPLHFQWSAELVQSRWYWVDRSLGSQSRSVRLSYHALTRRWRLSVGSGGMSYSLHQNFESLREALLVASRVSDLKVAEPAQLSGGGLRVDFRFAIDLSQWPRPFQLGLTSQSGWNMTQQKTLAVPERLTSEGDTESAEPRGEGGR
jgi:Domain of unknown function (DUF4390)